MKAYNKKEIKQYINKTFGFIFNKIVLLECAGSPYDYVMFRVCGNTYQVINGKLNMVININGYYKLVELVSGGRNELH